MTAPWAARYGHTSVIDAAGAIYVIGGADGRNYLNDVLVSTDGGAQRGWFRGTKGVLSGTGGTQKVPRDTRSGMVLYGVHEGCRGVLDGTLGVH
jgi:hypothetical protein